MDYNKLPLASIPESKDSILEENSQWHNTVKSKKLLMSSALQKEGCSCCQNCQENKKYSGNF